MKKSDLWKETKYVRNINGSLIASREPSEVAVRSRLVADLTAQWYDRNIPAVAKGKLLDLGCGKAPLFGTYSAYVDDVVLADWINTEHKNELLDVECDITRELPFENKEFDTIILSDVLEHIPNPYNLMLELHRILKPGGSVLMNTPFMYWVHEAPHDYNRYTEFMLKRLVEDSNMKVVKIEPLGGGWVVLIDLLSKLFYKLPLVVRIIQKVGPKIFRSRINHRIEIPISYATIFNRAEE